jgi:TetR/AcrR family transcriptional repressor of mexJK operon
MSARGRPKSDKKRQQILDAAAGLFAERGFERGSLEDIAQVAGVSKQTIYNHFANKTALLRACIEQRCDDMIAPAVMDYELPPTEFVSAFVERFVNTLTEPGPLRMYRLCMSESERHPEVGEAFWEAGPLVVMEAFSKYLRLAEARGELKVESPEIAAGQFLFMVKGLAVDTSLLFLSEWPHPFSRQEYVDSCTDMFLRAHRPDL